MLYSNYIIIIKSITSCVIKRWSNTKVQLRRADKVQLKGADNQRRDNENNR